MILSILVYNGVEVKKVANWKGEYITPLGLTHWLMQDGTRQVNQSVYLATYSFTI